MSENTERDFELLETLALCQGQWRHGAAHLARLRQAAAHFGFRYEPAHVSAAMQALAQAHAQGLWRARLLLNAQGQLTAQAFALDSAPPPTPVRLQLATQPFAQAHSEFTRFKTTRRAHYEAMAPTEPGLFDTLLWNTQGELTECTRGNIAVQLRGQWLTPALHCGLLAGVGRAQHLASGEMREAVLTLDDLAQAQDLAFLNSLRGWVPAQLERSAR